MTATPLPTETATDTPADAATGAIDAVATAAAPAPSPSPSPEPAVKAAEGIKEVVAEKGGTAAGVVETLDEIAIDLGSFHVSLWDAIVFLSVLVGIYLVAFFLSRFARRLLRRLTRFDETQRLLAEKLITIAVWAIAILLGIDILGIDLTALAVFSGAFGLAIGFGLQKTFGNLIAGIILLMDRSIKPGDVIAIADQAGNSTFGQIRKIGIRAVSLTTRDQKEYLIPNENLMVNQVENWSYSSRNVRVQVPVGVSYNCDLEVAEKLMLEAARGATRVLTSPPPTVWLDAYGDSSVNFIIHCWINDPEEGVGNVKSDVLKRLWKLFADNDVEIPFPQRDINLRDNAQFQQLVAAISQRLEKPDPRED
ncbi:putative MscS family protein.1 precursor [Tsuneonella dongtanensis]|uniref:Putative MscS family protein.1 n=1 Tax=Tsuneonella dongtanensis TaxID=692370 RepID=A0A1B2AD69_9SPHN|nr:mechanosensitive ion channel domain-containing protein [Tsuneonella dongtanensis]ANY20041.1 putative MscS family protein.1 precursor [Tsuneonella dongtanensis]